MPFYEHEYHPKVGVYDDITDEAFQAWAGVENRVQCYAYEDGDIEFQFADGSTVRTWSMFFSITASTKGGQPIPVSQFGLLDVGCGKDCGHSSHVKKYHVGQDKESDVRRIVAELLPKFLSLQAWQSLLDLAKGGDTFSNLAMPDFKVLLVKENILDQKMGEREKEDRKRQGIQSTTNVEVLPRVSVKSVLNKSGRLASKVGSNLNTAARQLEADEPQRRMISGVKSTVKSGHKESGPPVIPARQNEIFRAEFVCHKSLLPDRIPYYRYLKSTVQYADSNSSDSKLPWPTITKFALGAVIGYVYCPDSLGTILGDGPDLWRYIRKDCPAYFRGSELVCDGSILRDKLEVVINKLVELWRAADYLRMDDLSKACWQMLCKLAHTSESCSGSICSFVLPKILQAISYEDAPRCFEKIKRELLHRLAFFPGDLWKRTLILCPDDVLRDLVLVVKDKRLRHPLNPKDYPAKTDQASRSWSLFETLMKLQSNVHASASTKLRARWDELLLQPLIEYSVHDIASIFDLAPLHRRIVDMAGGLLAVKDEDTKEKIVVHFASFGRSNVTKLLGYITITSPQLTTPPFDLAVLRYETVFQIYAGISELKEMLPDFPELHEADNLVLDYLKREWLSMSLGGGSFMGMNRSMFSKLAKDELLEFSRRLCVPMDELLAKGVESSKAERLLVSEKQKDKEKQKKVVVTKPSSSIQTVSVSPGKSRRRSSLPVKVLTAEERRHSSEVQARFSLRPPTPPLAAARPLALNASESVPDLSQVPNTSVDISQRSMTGGTPDSSTTPPSPALL